MIKKFSKNTAKAVDDLCGKIWEIYEMEDLGFSLITIIRKTVKHKHERTQEFYFLVEGEGILRIENEEIHVKKGDLIPIPVGKFHELEPIEPIELLLVSHPRLIKSDVIKFT